MKVEFLPSGDTALTVQFGKTIDRTLSRQIMAFRKRLQDAGLSGVIETVPTYRSLLVHFDPLILGQEDLINQISPFIDDLDGDVDATGERWTIPVCFDAEFCPDLAHVASQSGLSPQEVITALVGTKHYVYMLGFAPGQPYMGDLPDELNIPRRTKPVPRIEKGSFVTATGLTIIYPVANPTGWHVVGRTPIDLFDLDRAEPVLLSPGDEVTVRQIDKPEFDELAGRVAEKRFDSGVLKGP